jgi:hypothetical protein
MRRPGAPALALTAVLLALLTACGGGGGSDSTPAPVPDTTPTALDLAGTAAVGKALAGATISAKCATGTGSATAGADGSYSLRITGGVLPCVLQAVSGTTTLHSVAQGTGRSATANISPLTELVLAQANGGDAAALFGSFDAAAQAKVSTAALATATSSVQTALASVVDIAGVNPFTDALVAATGSSTGNALDAKLDSLGSKLGAARMSLAELISTMARNGAAAATVVASQVQPATSHCASLRSGAYVIINPTEDAAHRVQTVVIDAVALTARTEGSTEVSAPVAPVAGKPCHFRTTNGNEDFVVSPTGVIVNRYQAMDGSNLARLAIGLPKQTLAAADLAGTWNTVEYGPGDTNGNVLANSYAVATVDNTGSNISVIDCVALQPCSDAVPVGLRANPDGGFDATGRTGEVMRLFAYRAANGNLLLAGISSNGSFLLGTRQTNLALPTNGEQQSYWDVGVNSQAVAGTLNADVRTVTAVDAAAGSYTRSASYTGLIDGFTINSPRNGLRTRATCTNSSGNTVACGLIALPLTGMGMTVYGSSVTTSTFYGISVARPAGSTSTGVQSADSAAPAGTAAPGTLVVTGGETYPLRASMTISSAGQITGGQYDFHKIDGTMTACEHSAANDAVCHGASANFSVTSQSGPMTTAGSTSSIRLIAGPDIYGYTYTGTLVGVRWTGTWTKVAVPNVSTLTGSGSFAVDLVITQQ